MMVRRSICAYLFTILLFFIFILFLFLFLSLVKVMFKMSYYISLLLYFVCLFFACNVMTLLAYILICLLADLLLLCVPHRFGLYVTSVIYLNRVA